MGQIALGALFEMLLVITNIATRKPRMSAERVYRQGSLQSDARLQRFS